MHNLDLSFVTKIAVSLFPVFIFLVFLLFIDSYKLVRLRIVLLSIFSGFFAAGISYFINTEFLSLCNIGLTYYSRYAAPLVEELIKSLFIVYLIRTRRIGFLVDGGILGFAAGAGFALIENILYLYSIPDASVSLWIIRGFGTSVMHGGTTAVFAIISKNIIDRKGYEKIIDFIPGFVIAFTIHSMFNHFLFPPFITMLIQLIALPLLIANVFRYSEQGIKKWLEAGFDTDVELLKLITTGSISETNIGTYLASLKHNFPGEIIMDMLCLLRIHLELTIRAKGILLMKEAGLPTTQDPTIREKFAELKYLEKNIGKTGMLAATPILHTSSQDLWQLHMLNNN